MLLSKISYIDSFRFTLGHLQFSLILDPVVLRRLVLRSGEQTWLIFHAGGKCACVGKAALSGVWSLVRGGHLKMVASPTSESFCRSQILNAVVVKLSVLFLCVFFFPTSSTVITCFADGCTRIYRLLEIHLAILRQISLINELLNSKILCSSI